MADQRNRPRPSAMVGSSDRVFFGRKIILSTGRGDTRITPAEARDLAAELLAAADEVEQKTAAAEAD